MRFIEFRTLAGRGTWLAIGCLFVLAWNLALSTQRRNLDGQFFSVKKETLVIKVSCPGKIEPKVFETVRSEIDGRKLNVLVNVGDVVNKGQLLMEISDEKIKVELTQKRTSTKNLRSDMFKAKKDYQLEKGLYAAQAVPLVNVENAKERYERALQSYEISAQELELTEKKAKGVRVLAPMSGVVIRNYVEKDDWISAGKEIFEVAKLDKFVVRGKVDEIDIGRIKLDQDAVVVCDAYKQTEMKGVVNRIGAQAGDGAFAEIEVVIDILDTKELELKPNLSAEASIVTGRIRDGIIIPIKAIRSGPQGAYVLARKFGGWVAPQPVKVDQISADRALVGEGLAPGRAVLIPKGD